MVFGGNFNNYKKGVFLEEEKQIKLKKKAYKEERLVKNKSS